MRLAKRTLSVLALLMLVAAVAVAAAAQDSKRDAQLRTVHGLVLDLSLIHI